MLFRSTGEVLYKVLLLLWKINGFEVRVLSSNKYLFVFSSEQDKVRVLHGELWNFDNHFLALGDVNIHTPLAMITFDEGSIWV